MNRVMKRLGLGMATGILIMGGVALMAGRLLAIEGAYTHLRLFNEVLSIIRSSYVDEVQSDALIQGAYEGMLSELDPFSEYFTPAEYAEFGKWQESRKGEAAAKERADVGLRLARRDGMVIVVSVRPGSDAEARGITPGDLLRRVEDRAAREMGLFQIESAMSGPAGSSVKLEFARREEPRRVEASFLRKEKTLQPVTFEMIDPAAGIALIKVSQFLPGTATQLAGALERAARMKAQRLLIDLRGNAWGTMEEAARAIGVFAGNVTVGRLSGREGSPTELRGGRDRVTFNGRIGLLMNGSTAQAAEMFAAGLSDLTGATLMGESTFGIGAEQELLPLRNGAWLRLSTRRYFSPAGTAWHGTGLKPAKILTVTADGLPYAGRMSRQLTLAVEHLKSLTGEPVPAARAGAAAS